jgi:hypothetical protein
MRISQRQRYVRRPDKPVIAVRLDLETDGFFYQKWGGKQRAKSGDWIVDNKGDVYTVDADVFARTYRRTGPGKYVKTTPIWAASATHAGSVRTKEGVTHYVAGDYIVSNDEDGSDGYAVTAKKFKSMYRLAKRKRRTRRGRLR